jgi:hypothetical protein
MDGRRTRRNSVTEHEAHLQTRQEGAYALAADRGRDSIRSSRHRNVVGVESHQLGELDRVDTLLGFPASSRAQVAHRRSKISVTHIMLHRLEIDAVA